MKHKKKKLPKALMAYMIKGKKKKGKKKKKMRAAYM